MGNMKPVSIMVGNIRLICEVIMADICEAEPTDMSNPRARR